ncbi:putative signal transducing protein [Flavobacterium anhuiense]|uniref:putative signal transducing protein n=1 Tax=Flavobacterium anhuiense TaxID=459526 RepID=UPI003D98AD4C
MKEDFKLVKSYQYSSEAQIFCGKLESEGIEVYLRDNHIVDSNPIWSNAVGGVKLFVKEEDFEKANEILSTVSPYSVDEKNNLIKCPNCGAEKVEMITSIRDARSLIAFVFSLLFGVIPFYSKYRYKCSYCKTEF